MILQGHIKSNDFRALRAIGVKSPALANAHCWVIALDERQALLFAKSGSKLESLGRFEARDPVQSDIAAASDGVHIDGSHDRSRYQPAQTELRQTELRFTHKLAAWLDKASGEKAFDKLILVAGPRMLGEMRQALSERVKKTIEEEVHKDVAGYGEERLLRELPRFIPGPDRAQ